MKLAKLLVVVFYSETARNAISLKHVSKIIVNIRIIPYKVPKTQLILRSFTVRALFLLTT